MTKQREKDVAMELVGLCGPMEADMIEEILENNGIPCSLQGEAAANTLPAAGELDEVRIFVQPKDAARARELVEDFFTPVAGYESGEEDSSEEPD